MAVRLCILNINRVLGYLRPEWDWLEIWQCSGLSGVAKSKKKDLQKLVKQSVEKFGNSQELYRY
jgi:hypothetical protein